MGRVTERRKVIRIRDGALSSRPDTLVAEEPLEIRLNGKPLAITMRTPGDDFALATGFLVSEGVLTQQNDLQNIVYCADNGMRWDAGFNCCRYWGGECWDDGDCCGSLTCNLGYCSSRFDYAGPMG